MEGRAMCRTKGATTGVHSKGKHEIKGDENQEHRSGKAFQRKGVLGYTDCFIFFPS
jgi:hypothetical protein